MECQKPTLLVLVQDPGFLAFDYRRLNHHDEVLDTSVVIMHLPSLVARTVSNPEVETSEELGPPSLSSI